LAGSPEAVKDEVQWTGYVDKCDSSEKKVRDITNAKGPRNPHLFLLLDSVDLAKRLAAKVKQPVTQYCMDVRVGNCGDGKGAITFWMKDSRLYRPTIEILKRHGLGSGDLATHSGYAVSLEQSDESACLQLLGVKDSERRTRYTVWPSGLGAAAPTKPAEPPAVASVPDAASSGSTGHTKPKETANCSHCKKLVSRDEVLQCTVCKRVIYCPDCIRHFSKGKYGPTACPTCGYHELWDNL
jgi:hypothetical protein